jgi:AP-1 complex subunit sigma 1/2
VSCLGRTPAEPDRVTQILDELIIAGELQESSKKSVLRVVCQQRLKDEGVLKMIQVAQSDSIEDAENSEDTLARLGSRSG